MRLIGFREPRTQPFKGVFARTSTFSTCGGTANNSLARAVNAFAISPVKWALRPASFAKVSKMPNFPGPILIAYHFKVAFSFSASGRADFRNASASASLPARASSVTNNPIASIELPSRVELVPADRPLLTTVSKLQIENRLVRISAGMVGILLNSCSARENSNDLHLSLRFVWRERRGEFEMNYGVAESELFTED